MTDKELQLLEIAKQVLEMNKENLGKMMLTGSLMLALRGINKRREACDIDILCNQLTASELGCPILPKGFKIVNIDGQKSEVNAVQYKNEEGLKVEFMFSEDKRSIVDGIYCAEVVDTLYAKVSYGRNDKADVSRFKHLDDVLYILEHNDAVFTPAQTTKNSADDLPF